MAQLGVLGLKFFYALLEFADAIVGTVKSGTAGKQFRPNVLVFAAEELDLLFPSVVLFELSAIHGSRKLPPVLKMRARKNPAER